MNAGKLGRRAEKEAEQVKVGTGEGSRGPGEVCRCRCIVYVKRGQKNILYIGAGMVRMNRQRMTEHVAGLVGQPASQPHITISLWAGSAVCDS